MYSSNTMIGYSTITQKGQVTIPSDIRKELGLLPRQQVVIVTEADGAKVRVIPSISSLRGSIETRVKFNIKSMRKSAKKAVAKRYLKTLRHG